MSQAFEQLKHAVSELPTSERAELAELLLRSLGMASRRISISGSTLPQTAWLTSKQAGLWEFPKRTFREICLLVDSATCTATPMRNAPAIALRQCQGCRLYPMSPTQRDTKRPFSLAAPLLDHQSRNRRKVRV